MSIEKDEPIIWAGVAHIEDEKLLTIKESDKPFYMLPGGKQEEVESEGRLETDEEIIVREISEELGVGVGSLVFLSAVRTTSKATGQLIEFRVYTGVLTEIPNINSLPGKTVDIKFLDSNYEAEGFEVGHLPEEVIPLLVEKRMIV